MVPAERPEIADAGSAGASGKLGGAASGARASATSPRPVKITRVEVAVESLTAGTHRQSAKGRPRCRWLSSAGRLVTRRSATGKCDNQLWLPANGTTNWRIRFRHRLPAGRYVLFARALDAAGSSDLRFSTNARNEQSFSVR